jgi:signal peptidase I
MSQTNRYLWCLVILGLASMLVPLRTLHVRGTSMEPTLHNGQKYILDRLYFRPTGVHVGDVIVILQDGEEIVKRVVGLPGDRLQETLYIDGTVTQAVNITRFPRLRSPVGRNCREKIVPKGMVYVVGDNTQASEDSRKFGPLPLDKIVGVVRTFTFARHFPEPTSRDLAPQRLRASSLGGG